MLHQNAKKNYNISKRVKMNNQIIRLSSAQDEKRGKRALCRYVKEPRSEFVKVEPGIYAGRDAIRDDMLILSLKFPKLIFSHLTALFLFHLADHEPFYPIVTMPNGYNPSPLYKRRVQVFTVRKDLFEVGLTERKTMYGNYVRCYNLDRTIVDLIRSRSRMELEQYMDGIKHYFDSPDKNLPLLTQYAEIFHVKNQVQGLASILLN